MDPTEVESDSDAGSAMPRVDGKREQEEQEEQAEQEEEEEDAADFYTELNLPRDATPDQVRESYKRLSRVYHPDKHRDMRAKELAASRFRAIQRAYEVLVDPVQREVYDNFGTSGLALDWQVGPRTKSVAELRRDLEQQMHRQRQEDVDKLVKSRSEVTAPLSLDPIFRDFEQTIYANGKLYKIADPGVRGRLRLCTIQGFTAKHSFAVPFSLDKAFGRAADGAEKSPQTSLHLTAQTNSLKAGAGNNLMACVRHQARPDLLLEAGTLLVRPQAVFAKATWSPAPTCSMTGQVSAASLAAPPVVSLSVAQQMTKTGVATVSYKTGVWALGPWGSGIPAERRGLESQFVVGWTQQQAPARGTWSVNVAAGLMSSGVATEYSIPIPGTESMRASARADVTLLGSSVAFGTSVRYNETTRLGATVSTALANGSLALKLTWTRLGQRLVLPITLSNEFNARALFFGVVVPASGLTLYELLVRRPAARKARRELRQERRSRRAQKREQAKQAALETVELLRDSVKRRQDAESARGGLVIERATYGSGLDVTIALAALAHDGQLVVPSGVSKARLPGFYDDDDDDGGGGNGEGAKGGTRRHLRVEYRFHGALHRVEVGDKCELLIPQKHHLVAL